MLRIWIATALSCASFMACAVAVEGVSKPADAVAKAADTLRMAPAANRSPEIALPALATQKRLATLEANQIGVSRKDDVDSLPRISESNLQWRAAAGGYAAHLSIVAPDASGLRVGLRFTALSRDLELRVAEMAAGGTPRVVATSTGAQILKLARGVFPIVHWTASTEGAQQLIELWSPRRPDASALRFDVVNVSHLVQRPLEPVYSKAVQFTCHVDVSCIADANVTQDSEAVARMLFTKDGNSFVCSGSLLADRPHSLTPLFATANHCISAQAVASTLETWWFYTSTACNSGTARNPTRLNGATLLMANFDTDFTLLQLAQSAPGGAFFLGWDGNPIPAGQSVFGLHHPDGSYQRYSSGIYLGLDAVTDDATDITFGQPMKQVEFTQGIIEGGSSGSPLLVLPGIFQGTLFGGPKNTCNGTVFASYSDFTVGYPLVKTFLDGPNPVDDYGDTPATAGAMSNNAELVADINTDGDKDWFKFTFTQPGQWTVASFDVAPGLGIDVKAEIYAANGSTVLASNDDQSPDNMNFSMSIAVTAGTYYVRVTAAPGVTGRYGLSSIFDEAGNTPAAASNALPINGTFSGYLGPLNDQDWFRLTFTQAGTFHVNSTGSTDTMGTLYQSDGVTQIAFNDDIQDAVLTNFTLTIAVSGPGTLYLKVEGFGGQNGAYGLQTTFTPGGANPNYTDLWWAMPANSEPGWGINLNHQSDIIFATLFTYAADHSGLWLVATMTKQANGSYTGALLQTVGPAFNASPWTAITPAQITQVGTMTVSFVGTNQGALVYTVNGTSVTKSIQREVFSTQPTCTFTTASRAAATNYQDLWWAGEAESGWGVNFTHQGTIIFATLFTYAANNRGLWLVATMNKQADGSFSGDLLRTTGPAFNAVPWAPPFTFVTTGTMRVAFSDGITGTLTYSVDGIQVVKPIQREVFGTPTVCQ